MANIERESINFKLPKTLTKALRTAARERNTTATDLVIQGLTHVLGIVPGAVSIETRLQRIEYELSVLVSSMDEGVKHDVDESLQQRLSLLEQRQESTMLKLAQLEGAISLLLQRTTTTQKRKSYDYHPPQLELQAYTQENLAKRLGVDANILEREFKNQSAEDFERWCKSRDPSLVGWRFGKDGLFHPVK